MTNETDESAPGWQEPGYAEWANARKKLDDVRLAEKNARRNKIVPHHDTNVEKMREGQTDDQSNI